jgi:sugar lactone lactonase YvrE
VYADLLLDARAQTAERPVWDADTQRLLWVDVPRGEVHSLDPATGRDEKLFSLGRPIGAAALREQGGLVLAVAEGFALLDAGTGELSRTLQVQRPHREVRMNDGLCDPRGRFLAGSMDEHGQGGALFRLERREAGYQIETLITHVRESNGLDWSPDGSIFYWVDTLAHTVSAFDYDVATGGLSRRRTLVSIDPREGLPDGLIVDAEGGVWVAIYDGGAVRRYDAGGRLTLEVRVPVKRPTCPTFGGRDLGELFITSQRVDPNRPDLEDGPHAGGIFACRPGFTGRPARRFAG